MNNNDMLLFLFLRRAQARQEKVTEAKMLLNCLHPNERKISKNCDEMFRLILSQIK